MASVVEFGSCSSPPSIWSVMALRVRQLDVTVAAGIQGWADHAS